MSDIVKRKLIEVALPLEAINVASAREKSIRHGHPSTLHLWWARRPLAACRAVLFASLVDDPSSDPDHFPTEKAQEGERQRLFRIIEDLVKWENSNNDEVLIRAKAEIMRSTGGSPPAVLDPFCGGGSIPLEALRLGLNAVASDLNPVAVLITKSLVEIPPLVGNKPPVHPDARAKLGATGTWKGATGLADDVRQYGGWMREEANRRIGHIYTEARIPTDHGGGKATVIAWVWARTIACPNPACGAQMPLIRSFELSAKPGREAWAVPGVDRTAKTVRFSIGASSASLPDAPKTGRGASFRCLICEGIAPEPYVKAEALAHRMSTQLMATVAEGDRKRLYLPPDPEQEAAALVAAVDGQNQEVPTNPRWFSPPAFGMTRYRDLFTPRQLLALSTFSDLVSEARELALRHAVAAGWPDDGVALDAGGSGALAYADAIATYLAFAVDKAANYWSALCAWHAGRDIIVSTYSRQALAMVWDFAEANPFSGSSGNFLSGVEQAAQMLEALPSGPKAAVRQADAREISMPSGLVCTDPPYYDNIGYSDLSDFFYVWLRRSLGAIYPSLFSTVLTPKSSELIATPFRFDGNKSAADAYFEAGLKQSFASMRAASDSRFPMTVFYAFRQAESDSGSDGASVSTGWETMLEALLGAGLSVDGTWPVRTELTTNLKRNVGALASSIVLSCRTRTSEASVTTRKEFLSTLQHELPRALRALQHGNIAPVDLAQAAIGPGMSVFSRFEKVLESDGSRMRVRTALALINQTLSGILAEQEGDFDPDTRWAVAWYEQFGLSDGPYGQAEVLSKAKDVGIEYLMRAGVVGAARGKVRLVGRDEYQGWDPAAQSRLSVWEITQRLIRSLRDEGETGTAALLARVGGLAESARTLAYQLHGIAEKKGWSDEGQAYNALVVAWPTLMIQAEQIAAQSPEQSTIEFA